MEKTLAMKVLEGKKIPYEVCNYPATERSAEQIAVIFGVSGDELYKTLVVVRDGGKKPLLVLIAADQQLDLKKVAKVVGEKKVRMATHVEAEGLTGLQVGGISPLALLNKGFTIYVDEHIFTQESVFVSAGQRGCNLRVGVLALVRVIGAKSADVVVSD